MLTLLVLLAAFGGAPDIRVDPLALTPEMQAWVAETAPRDGPPELRWRHLGRALTRSRDFVETPLVTTTAGEAFGSGRGNCVAFAHLAVALAREAGVDAYFVLVEENTRTLRRGDLRVAQGHLAAAFGEGGGAVVLDLGGLHRDDGRTRRISDRTARAIFLSNQGAERLLAGAPGAASLYLRAAVHEDADLAWAWANLGVAERRAGRPGLAVLAYRQALALAPELATARHNLAFLEGRPGRR